jgi:Zn-dependent protease
VHEFGHAATAYLLGDDTAQRAGRLTLNPLAHIDKVGSLLLPLALALLGGPMFAFAKPVPYNPRHLRNPKRDEVLVALAGPATNILQAVAGTLVLRLLWRLGIFARLSQDASTWLQTVLLLYVYANCTLCFFNLLPIPPLDGSSIVVPLLKGRALETYYRVQGTALPLLLVALYVLPQLLGIDLLGRYLDGTAGWVFDLLMSW